MENEITTITGVLYYKNTIEPNRAYFQKTNVRNGVYSARAVMLISERDAANTSKVKFTFSNGTRVAYTESTKCYKTVTAGGDTLDAPEGYVYVACSVNNIPSGITLTCTGIELI